MSSLVCPADARLVVHLVKVVWGWDQPCCTLGSHYFSFPMLTPQGSVLSLDLWSPSSIPRETQVINRALLDHFIFSASLVPSTELGTKVEQ